MNAETVHRLGTTGALAAAGLALLLVVTEVRERTMHVHRLRRALDPPTHRRAPGVFRVRGSGPDGLWQLPGRLRDRAGRLGGGAAAGALLGGLLGGRLGLVAGAVVGAGAAQWRAVRRTGAAAPAGEAEADPSDVALCADLMAACLAAGATPGEAAGAVGDCLGGPLGAALIRAQAELRLGAEPVECWQRLGLLAGAREMARCLARASTTGSAPVAEIARLAADIRAAHGRSALARARRAAVLATAPLGVCFLPAFLLVGVAPVVMGLAGTVLGGAVT